MLPSAFYCFLDPCRDREKLQQQSVLITCALKKGKLATLSQQLLCFLFWEVRRLNAMACLPMSKTNSP